MLGVAIVALGMRTCYTWLAGRSGAQGILPAVVLSWVAYVLGLSLCSWPLRRYATAWRVGFAGWCIGGLLGFALASPWPPDRVHIASLVLSLVWFGGTSIAVLSALVWLHNRYRPPLRAGHCVRCGYDLRGLADPRCPECGTPFSTEAPRDQRPLDAGFLPPTCPDGVNAVTTTNPVANPETPATDVENLRRAVRRLQLLAAGALALSVVALAAVVGLALARAGDTTAENVWLRTPSGLIVASLAQRREGSVEFAIGDAGGRTRAALIVRDDGAPGLVLRDQNGQQRLAIALSPSGDPGLWMFDQASRPRVVVGAGSEGTWGISVRDERGVDRLVCAVDQSGSPGFSLTDADRHTRMVADVATDGFPAIAFRDDLGTVRVELGVWTQAGGGVIIRDEAGKDRVILGTAGEGPPGIEIRGD
jgi:hypothetical protein